MPGQCGNSVVMDTQYVGVTDAVQREVLVKVGGQCGDGCVKWSVDQHPLCSLLLPPLLIITSLVPGETKCH